MRNAVAAEQMRKTAWKAASQPKGIGPTERQGRLVPLHWKILGMLMKLPCCRAKSWRASDVDRRLSEVSSPLVRTASAIASKVMAAMSFTSPEVPEG
jgi:hypothetical protein